MKKYLSILVLSLSVLVTANPIISWNCNEMVMSSCMEMEEDTLPCCATDAESSHQSMADMLCCSPMARINTVHIDLQVEQTEAAPEAKGKKAAIQAKWFNSNYLTDLKSVSFTAYPTPIAVDGFKFDAIDRLSYICIYRI
ncbi:hypothetical protein [Myroides sp. DF42-4-2]|uniref:hypothetical protein n=1 Tax=unclassified Myroides TaxID=2642485 RepID=UPI002575774E|nr:hypothetical protein [Myroides sp. DF42-4-2]MDM1408754.1 hypothetical protein [Myroides sp. DF42-4-2]